MSDRENVPARVEQGYGMPAPAPEYLAPGGFGEEAGGSNTFTPARLLRAVVRYKWLVLTLALAGAAAALYATRFLELSYTAESRLWIEVVTRNDQLRGPIRSSELLQNDAWLELLRSHAVLDSVAVQQRLFVEHSPLDADVVGDMGINAAALRPGAYVLASRNGMLELRSQEGALIERVEPGEVVGSSIGLVWRPALRAGGEPRTIAFNLIAPRQAGARLNSRLNGRLARGGSFMWISYTAEDPAEAARVANAVAERYVEVAAELKRAKLDELRDILERQLKFAENNLREAELALERFRVATITLPTDAPMAAGEETRGTVVSAFFDLKMQREMLQRDRAAIQRVLSAREGVSVDALSAVPVVGQSPELRQALSELATKRAERRALLLQYTEEHPLVVRASTDVQQLERQTVPALAQRLAAEIGQQLGQIDGMVNSASEELRQIPSRAIDQARYRREVATAENLFNDLRQRYEGARLAAETTIPDVRVLDPAAPPRSPSMDQRLMLLMAGFAGSLALGLILAVGLDRMDPRLRYAEQVTQDMGLTIIGAVPNLAQPKRLGNGGNGRAVVATQARPEVLEALRAVRLNLMHAYGSAGPMILTVTSPGAGDGKTFMTSNLALMYADLGLRALVVDGDTRRGCLHRMFAIDRRPGLTEYLDGSIPLDHVIRTTRYPLVDVIPSGARLPNAPELLSSSRLGDLLGAIRSEYDIILIDSPPLGAGIDPLVLGTLSGNVLLVMRTGSTDRAMAEAKLKMLDRLPVRVLGAVLNGFESGEAYRYYSYMPGYEAGLETASSAPTVLQRG